MSLVPKNHRDAYPWLTHKGWTAFSYADDYGQGKVKEIFIAVNQTTAEEKYIDITPWFPVDLTLVRRVIDLDFPPRIGLSPLTHEDLDQIEAYGKAAE